MYIEPSAQKDCSFVILQDSFGILGVNSLWAPYFLCRMKHTIKCAIKCLTLSVRFMCSYASLERTNIIRLCLPPLHSYPVVPAPRSAHSAGCSCCHCVAWSLYWLQCLLRCRTSLGELLHTEGEKTIINFFIPLMLENTKIINFQEEYEE